MARRFTREDLPHPEQRAAVDAQLGYGPETRGGRIPATPKFTGKATGPETFESLRAATAHAVVAIRGPYRSKAEADYAAFLASLPGVTWRYERLSIGLPGKGTRYKPDFSVRGFGETPALGDVGTVGAACVEVKGTKDGRPYWRTHGHRRRALDGAAELWEALRIPLFVAWKVKGEWKHERVEVRDAR